MYPEEKDEIVQLYLDDIIPNRFQPREIFDEKALKELAISIREHGLIQPIIVRSVNGKYEIIAGERRYKASALAGLTKIPAIIRNLDDKESSKVALLENLQRKNLNPIEEARTYQKILEIDQMTQDELAKTMGKSQSSIANKIRLLSLPEEIQTALLKEQISERHARALLNLQDSNQQISYLKKIIDNKMSVRALEEEIKALSGQQEVSNLNQPIEEPKQPLINLNQPVEEPKQPLIDLNQSTIPSVAFPQKSEGIPELTPSSISFVNEKPLTPTTELPKDESNYGKVTIAPPEGEEDNMPSKFINYGELGKEDKEETSESLEKTLGLPFEAPAVDLNKIKETAKDIAPQPTPGGADLDSLLNLGNPTASKPTNQFITPAEKIVKTDPEDETNEKNSDYFKLPEFTNNGVSSIENGMNNSIFMAQMGMVDGSAEEDKGPYTIEQGIEKIKELLDKLKEHGVPVNANEMNFEKSYQIIIKIDKTGQEE